MDAIRYKNSSVKRNAYPNDHHRTQNQQYLGNTYIHILKSISQIDGVYHCSVEYQLCAFFQRASLNNPASWSEHGGAIQST